MGPICIVEEILKIKPQDVKPFGMSKQTLWNMKRYIRTQQLERVSDKIKIKFLKLSLIN